MGQFVEVLNAKKDEIERLRQEICRLNEKLEAERVGMGRIPSLVPTPAAMRLRAGSDDSAMDSDGHDSSDDQLSVRPPNPGKATRVAPVYVFSHVACLLCLRQRQQRFH